MLSTYIAEALGTFVFFAVILTSGEPIMIAVGLLIGIIIASISSQSHLNPAVTTMKYMQGSINGEETFGYIAAQLIAAILAVQWYSFNKKTFKLSAESL